MDINAASNAISSHVEGQPSVSGRDALSQQERIFVDVFVGNGGKAGEAARAAGYADASADVTACKLLCRPRVAHQIRAQCESFAHAVLPVAIRTLAAAAGDEKALWKDRIKAANSLIELAGMTAPHGGVHINVGVQVNGQQAQALIGEVWNAKKARLSDIPTAMPDTIDVDLNDIERLAISPPADPPGGDQLQGPGAGTCPVPVSPSAQCHNSDVSQPDPFRGAFDDDSQGDDDGVRPAE